MGETRWLDEEEQRTWRTFMLATRMLTDQLDSDLHRDTDVPAPYYEVLVRLSEAPGRRLRMRELASLSQSSRSRLSHSVARLEEEGWIRREACDSDRRGSWAVLTDAGFAALEAAAPVHVEAVRTHLFDQLRPEQLEVLRGICERLLEHLVAIHGTTPEEMGLLGFLGACGGVEAQEPAS
jgi:DNA-binding MarR family transcriptional regulator